MFTNICTSHVSSLWFHFLQPSLLLPLDTRWVKCSAIRDLFWLFFVVQLRHKHSWRSSLRQRTKADLLPDKVCKTIMSLFVKLYLSNSIYINITHTLEPAYRLCRKIIMKFHATMTRSINYMVQGRLQWLCIDLFSLYFQTRLDHDGWVLVQSLFPNKIGPRWLSATKLGLASTSSIVLDKLLY